VSLAAPDLTALSRQIRTELSDTAPQGFHFGDQVLRQDAGLERLATHLRSLPPAELGAALSESLLEEKDGWTLLKLLELVERLETRGCADALVELAQNPPGEGDRRKFLAGRACEVLLRLPLDERSRHRADAACKIPLQEIQLFRLGADRERKLHRPRRVEWALLMGLMLLALTGLWLALRLPT